MGNLTAFLILRNEELLLPRCLNSLVGVVDSIVALDTGSQDRTPTILAQAAGNPALPPLHWDILEFTDFYQVRRAALDRVRTEWALWIDGDEAISPTLRDRLRQLHTDQLWDQYDAFEIRLENRVFGKVMRGRNLAGQYRPRLFRTGVGTISKSCVHEGLDLPKDCRLKRLEEPLYHDTMISWRRYLSKIRLYTDLELASLPRRHLSYLLAHLVVTGPATLWREYIWRTGFRDGWPGLVWAATTAWSSLFRDLKLLRRYWRESRSSTQTT